jgi:serine/threonine protein kinase
MVMDFEQGQSLEAWLKALGRAPSQDELDRIAAPLLDALEMMHNHNFLHRDTRTRDCSSFQRYLIVPFRGPKPSPSGEGQGR